jgi:hypothetical protein
MFLDDALVSYLESIKRNQICNEKI